MAEGAAEAQSEQCWQWGLQTWAASPGHSQAEVPAPASERPPLSALPRAGLAPMALTQQREGGVLSLRGPRFSRPTIERVSFFRRLGCENQVRPARQRTVV